MLIRFLLLLLVASCASNTKTILKPSINEQTEYFSSTVKYEWMADLLKCSNKVINSSNFITDISSIDKFDFSEDPGSKVAEKLLSKKYEIKIYKSANPFSKALAYTNLNSNIINFNSRRNPRNLIYMINTALHEATHSVGYTHGDNYSVGKQDSIPYKIGSIAQKWASKICNLD